MGLRLAACAGEIWVSQEQLEIMSEIMFSLVILGCAERYSEGWKLTEFGHSIARILKAEGLVDTAKTFQL